MLRLTRMIAVVGLVAAMCATAIGAVSAADLRSSDVVFEKGVPYDDADRQRLQAAADDLRDKDFPVKFVAVVERVQNPDLNAVQLRSALAAEIGEANIDGVFVLGPRQLGMSADAFPREQVAAFEAERATLESDPIQGAINVAKRLQDCDARNALDEECGVLDRDTGNGFPFPLILLVVVAAVGAFAFTRVRRSVKRAEERKAQERSHDEEREAFAPMLDILSSQITDLGDEVVGPGRERAKAHYDDAVTRYGQVRDALEHGEEWDGDVMRDSIRQGIRSALAARAVIDGKSEPPAGESILTGLCAFDPKHGRAVGDRRITTPSGDGAEVPVCASCAAGLDRGETPSLRLVSIAGVQQPYWQIQGIGDMFGSGMSREMAAMIEQSLDFASSVLGRGR